MSQQASERYRAALSGRVPKDRGEIFLGYVPGAAEVQATRAFDQRVERESAVVSRTAWRTRRGSQIVVEVVETRDAEAAMAALAERLSWNQLAQVPDGPKELGLASFAHPKGAAPAIFYVRGNLEIAVMGAQEGDDVAGIASAIDARLSAAWPPDADAVEVEDGGRLAVPEQAADPDVFVRVEVQGAGARLDDEHRTISISGGRGRVRAARIGRPEKSSRGLRLR